MNHPLARFRTSVAAAIVLGLSLGAGSAWAGPSLDTVVLKSGKRLRGTVMTDDPREGVSMKLPDGQTRNIGRAEVERIDYATSDNAGTSQGDESSGVPPLAKTDPSPSPAPPVAEEPRTTADPSGNGSGAPPGYHYEQRSLKGLWVSGLVIDLVVWGLRAGITGGVCASLGGCKTTTVAGAATPVIGAFIQLSSGIGDGSGQNSPGYGGALIVSSILETSGFIMFVTGLAVHRQKLVKDSAMLDLGPVRIAPQIGPMQWGLHGTF